MRSALVSHQGLSVQLWEAPGALWTQPLGLEGSSIGLARGDTAGEPHRALKRPSLVCQSSRRPQFICFPQQNLALVAVNLANPLIHHLNPGHWDSKQGAQPRKAFPQT